VLISNTRPTLVPGQRTRDGKRRVGLGEVGEGERERERFERECLERITSRSRNSAI